MIMGAFPTETRSTSLTREFADYLKEKKTEKSQKSNANNTQTHNIYVIVVETPCRD